MATSKKTKEKTKTQLNLKYDTMTASVGEYFDQLGKEFVALFNPKLKEELEAADAASAPSESDAGFTDEGFWGICTPAFILENGMAENEERAVEIAKYLKKNPSKKESSFFKELFVKAQFKVPTDKRRNSFEMNFDDLAIIAKDDPIKVEVVEQQKVETPSEEPNVANPVPQYGAAPAYQSPLPSNNPFGYNPVEPFLMGGGIQMDPVQPNYVSLNGVLYQTMQTPTGPAMVPVYNIPQQAPAQVNPTEPQQKVNPIPVGVFVKPKEDRVIVDNGMKIEGTLPSVDQSLIEPEKPKVKISIDPSMVSSEQQNPEDDVLSILKGGYPEISEENGNTILLEVLRTIKDSGFTCDLRELRDETMAPIGVYEFHLFNGDQELTDLKFIVDIGKIFDKRSKFCIGATANLESKEWFELQKNVGKNLVYTDEVLTKFFKNGRKWLFNQRPMYNKQWREINKNFVDLSTLPETGSKEARQKLNGIISDMWNCRELQAVISDTIPDPRFKVIKYEDGEIILFNDDVKDNILGSVRKDPPIGILYGENKKNVAKVKTPTSEVEVTVPHVVSAH